MAQPVPVGRVSPLGLQGPPGPQGSPGPPGPPGPPGLPGECTCPKWTSPDPATEAPTSAGSLGHPGESDCAGHLAAGRTESGVYVVGPASSRVEAYCDMDTAGGGWTVIQRREDGSVLFDRTWEEYKRGFGNKSWEHWLGNENIHRLTNQKTYRLRIDMEDWEQNRRFVEYNTFRVSDEASGYRLHISGYTGNVRDSLTYHNGQQFSTRDQDNDGLSGLHCAQRYGQGGWWYLACLRSGLNGQYLGNCDDSWRSCPNSQGVVWYDWRGRWYSLKAVSMKIKPQG
uniref:Fibrinogen C-terminal domain-containing protein n=1 Tax=Branchiostoma floridae TaxID=7739 RepID=C3YP62_BRAFL|eukprot:XP_002601941.1 hypothetical protein BRAFLDRAFT_86425 [Branchiostoma floridae]